MSGLYQKALAIQKKFKASSLDLSEELKAEAESGISFDDQVEIIDQINEIVTRSRIEIKPDTFTFIPKRSNAFIPVLINVLAAVTILLGVVLSLVIFNRQEKSLVTESAAVLTAESKLIEAFKRESDEQLNKKDQEILEIQIRLSDLSRERDSLKLETEAQIRQREEELRAALNREMEVERQKLQREGVSAETIDQQIRELQGRLFKENQEQMESFKLQTEADLAKKEATITVLMDEYNHNLEQFQLERTLLQEKLKEREEELQAQFTEKAEAMESERSRIAEQLNRLRDQRQREQLVFDQILSSYNKVMGALRAVQYEEALRNLTILEEFLDQESIASLPAMQRRRPVEIFVIKSLMKLIENERTSAEQDTASLIASADLLAAISRNVEQADNLFQAGDIPAAQELYLSAIEKIPDLKTSYATLKEVEQLSLEKERQELTDIMNKLEVELALTEKEIESQKQQLFRADTIEKQRAAMIEQLRSIRDRYAAFTENDEGSSGTSQEELLALLGAKLLVKQIINSEPVQTQYPELYDTMEQYFEAFGEEQRKEGQYATLRDLIEIMDVLILSKDKGELQAIWEKYDEKDQQELFSRLFDTLHTLLD